MPIGPNFYNELVAAGLAGLPFSWMPSTAEINYDPSITDQQKSAIEAVVTAHNAALPDPKADALAAMAAGISLTSTGDSALNGIYACDAQMQADIVSVSIYIQSTGGPGVGTFPDGGSTLAWLDTSNAPHTFDTTQFIAFAQATARFVTAVKLALIACLPAGKTWSRPSNTYTIA